MEYMNQPISNYWLDQFVDEVVAAYPTGEILVSSGISPSASYHIGHFREVLTADAIAWGIRERGREARHLHVVDNLDPLRKRYDFLPVKYDKYVGWPICLVPDPEGCHVSYAVHYTAEFKAAAAEMGVEMDVIYSYEDQYLTGKMAPYIESALDQILAIKRIFKEVAHRDLPEDWAPIQILSDSKSLTEWRYVSIDRAAKTINYRDLEGAEGTMRYDDGRVKLNWRLDWPARWALHGVQVEPFGKEHSTKGGSYETGALFDREIFKSPPPLPLPYDTINLVGENKKMSSSLGNLITPAEALEIMPPEILRYFVLRSLPKRILHFDSGLGLYTLIDEFSKVEDQVLAGKHPEFEQAYRVASSIKGQRTIACIAFSHLVSVYQAARFDADKALKILSRTGYEAVVSEQRKIILREFTFVANWLAKYAPVSVKFAVQDTLPVLELSSAQSAFLDHLADSLGARTKLDGQAMHDAIYEASVAAELKPEQAFQALYRVILNQDTGPKAGWFLSSLDSGWLAKRLRRQA